jgi:hypothetical protein
MLEIIGGPPPACTHCGHDPQYDEAIHRLYVVAMAARDHIAKQHLHPGGIRQRLCNQLSEAISGVGHLFVPGEAVEIHNTKVLEALSAFKSAVNEHLK